MHNGKTDCIIDTVYELKELLKMNFSALMKKIPAYILCFSLSLSVFTGCEKKDKNNDSDVLSSSFYSSQKGMSDYELCLDEKSGCKDIANYKKPGKGDEIIVMTIKDKGEIRIRLFPELLPRACANFAGLVKSGYYDGISFHRVIKDFMIQGGDPTASGKGGESIWGSDFDGGYSKYLANVSGALAYANAGGTSSDGSQFYIVSGMKVTKEQLNQYALTYGIEFSEKAEDAYLENGGAPWLDTGDYTVFGQVIEGMDIVNDICSNTETDEDNRPVEDVLIEKVTIEKYK